MTCYTIGFYRDDGDIAVLATLNNNDDIFNDADFESLSESLMVQMYERLHRKGDKETLLIKLNQQASPDYLTLED